MALSPQLEAINQLLQPLLTDDIFLVDLKVKPTNNFKIYLDADSGLGIEKCIKINRALYRQMEEAAMYPDGDFSLEVSSAGIDEPLKMHRQFVKNIGRNVSVQLIDAEKPLEGELNAVTEEDITVTMHEGKGKKATTEVKSIPFSAIKHVKVLISF